MADANKFLSRFSGLAAGLMMCCVVMFPADGALGKTRSSRAASDGSYTIEFRARPSAYFGHSYVRLNSGSGKGRSHTIGFYPKSVSAVFDAPGKAGATAADLRAKPTVAYRVAVSRESYRKALAWVERAPAKWTRYDLTDRNCNHLVGEIAGRLGLAVPGDKADLPENYVRALQAVNGGRARATWRQSR